MSNFEVGIITRKQCLEIEWTVEDIYSYTEVDQRLYSPRFSVPGSEWCLLLYPNGETEKNTVGWIGLYLMIQSASLKSAEYELGVRWQDGNVEPLYANFDMFGEAATGCGHCKFLEKSRLSCDSLTVTCTLKVEDPVDITSSLNRLSADYGEMFSSETGCDTTLKVQDERFQVNRSVLASRSPVFNAMFVNDMSEKNTGVVDIVDCHPGAFKDFLTYIYSGLFENSSGEVFELYKIAHKYDAKELKAGCVQFIISELSTDDVIDVAVFADEFDDVVLKRESQNMFDENFASIVSQDKWIALLNHNSILANKLLTNMSKTMDIRRKVNPNGYFKRSVS